VKPLVGNASDEEQVAKAGKKVKQREDIDVEDLKYIMDTPQGRRFVWRYLGLCGVYRLSFSGEASHETAFKEGARLIGTTLLNDINTASPEAYFKMIEESKREL